MLYKSVVTTISVSEYFSKIEIPTYLRFTPSKNYVNCLSLNFWNLKVMLGIITIIQTY